MPSYKRSAMAPTVINPKKAVAAKERAVDFPKSPVTGFSRPCNDSELWVLYNFEAHARKCASCHLPYEVYRNDKRLCPIGHTLAYDVAEYVYNRADGKTYAIDDDEVQPVVVEIPVDYKDARSLLKAMERSLRHRRRQPLLSYDKRYPVQARRSSDPKRERRNSVKIEQAPRSRRSSAPEIVDYPHDRRLSIEVADTRRGSLYYADMLAEERRLKKYNLEVREPSSIDRRERRTSGYYR